MSQKISHVITDATTGFDNAVQDTARLDVVLSDEVVEIKLNNKSAIGVEVIGKKVCITFYTADGEECVYVESRESGFSVVSSYHRSR